MTIDLGRVLANTNIAAMIDIISLHQYRKQWHPERDPSLASNLSEQILLSAFGHAIAGTDPLTQVAQ
jgi:hypothetical protein